MKSSGYFVISGAEKTVEGETLCCCHCGKHWVRIIGSGNDRGFCLSCSKVTCGRKECDECIPFEARLDFTDAYNVSIVNKLICKYPNIKSL